MVKDYLIVRKETRCRHIGYSLRLTARVLLYAPSHRQDNTYHGLCYTSCGPLAGTRNSSMGSPHEGPIAPWAKALTTELHLAPLKLKVYPINIQMVPENNENNHILDNSLYSNAVANAENPVTETQTNIMWLRPMFSSGMLWGLLYKSFYPPL